MGCNLCAKKKETTLLEIKETEGPSERKRGYRSESMKISATLTTREHLALLRQIRELGDSSLEINVLPDNLKEVELHGALINILENPIKYSVK